MSLSAEAFAKLVLDDKKNCTFVCLSYWLDFFFDVLQICKKSFRGSKSHDTVQSLITALDPVLVRERAFKVHITSLGQI